VHIRNKFQSNCMSYRFSLDALHRQYFIFWSSIRWTHHAFIINKCLRKIVSTELLLMPTLSAISCTLLNDSVVQYFQQHDSFCCAMLCISAAAIAVMRCPTVRPSVTFVDYVKTNKHIFEFFSPSGSHTILAFTARCYA